MIYLESTMFFLSKNTKYRKGRFVFHGVKSFRLRDKKTRFCSFAMVEGPPKQHVDRNKHAVTEKRPRTNKYKTSQSAFKLKHLC